MRIRGYLEEEKRWYILNAEKTKWGTNRLKYNGKDGREKIAQRCYSYELRLISKLTKK